VRAAARLTAVFAFRAGRRRPTAVTRPVSARRRETIVFIAAAVLAAI